jgi:hypothetical protein
MDLPTPPQAVAALAAFVRDRLNDVSGTLSPLWNRDAGEPHGQDPAEPHGEVQPAERMHPDRSLVASARQLALVIVGAAAPFAPTSYSRARLIRQMYASGLLTDEHLRRTGQVLDLQYDPESDVHGAPR